VEAPSLLTFTSKLGLVLNVLLSFGLAAMIALAPEPRTKDEDETAAVVPNGDKETAEKKPEKAEEKPPEKKKMASESSDKEEKKPAMKKKAPETTKEKKPASAATPEMKKPEKTKEKAPEKGKTKEPEKGVATAVLFEKHVLPIFQDKCVGCHGAGGEKGLDVRTMKTLLKGGDGGPAIVKGDLKKSILWELIDTEQMPQGDKKLTAEEKATIKKWIADGAKTAEMASK
jgi:mono/diheme cytochrome c family protein